MWNIRQLLLVLNKRINQRGFKERRRETLAHHSHKHSHEHQDKKKETYEGIVSKHNELVVREMQKIADSLSDSNADDKIVEMALLV